MITQEDSTGTFNDQEAVFGILYGLVMATIEESAFSEKDVVETDEMYGFARSVQWMKLFSDCRTIEAQMALNEKCSSYCMSIMTEDSIAEVRRTAKLLVSKCAVTLELHLRETVFVHVCNVAITDGVLSERERQFLEWLQGEMNIDPSLAADIIEVTVIRNRA